MDGEGVEFMEQNFDGQIIRPELSGEAEGGGGRGLAAHSGLRRHALSDAWRTMRISFRFLFRATSRAMAARQRHNRVNAPSVCPAGNYADVSAARASGGVAATENNAETASPFFRCGAARASTRDTMARYFS